MRGGYRWTDVETHPGAGYYTPSVSGSASITTLPMTDDEKDAADCDERGRVFGFAQAIADPLELEAQA